MVEAKLVLQWLEEERNLRLLDPHRQNRPPSGLGRWVIIWWYSAERRASQLRQGKPRDSGSHARVTRTTGSCRPHDPWLISSLASATSASRIAGVLENQACSTLVQWVGATTYSRKCRSPPNRASRLDQLAEAVTRYLMARPVDRRCFGRVLPGSCEWKCEAHSAGAVRDGAALSSRLFNRSGGTTKNAMTDHRAGCSSPEFECDSDGEK